MLPDLENDIPYGLPSLADLLEAATRTSNAAAPAAETPSAAAPPAAVLGETLEEPQAAAVSTPDLTPDPGASTADGSLGINDLWISSIEDGVRHAFTPEVQSAAAASAADDGVSADQILRDRPDVLANFYSEYWGPHNDRHSSAWLDRVGGETPQDYALYWYNKMGGKDSYQPSSHGAAAPPEGGDGADAPVGRTTLDGVPLSQILHDRPDVFQGFFTEYYGPNNDRHSSAWDDRVGGHTPEDYANFWYNTSGKLSGYVPSTAAGATPDAPTDVSPVDAPPDAPVDDGQLLQVGQTLIGPDPLTGT